MANKTAEDFPKFNKRYTKMNDVIKSGLVREARQRTNMTGSHILEVMSCISTVESKNITKLGKVEWNGNVRKYIYELRDSIRNCLAERSVILADNVFARMKECDHLLLKNIPYDPMQVMWLDCCEGVLGVYGLAMLESCCVRARFRTLADWYEYVDSIRFLTSALKSHSMVINDVMEAKRRWERKLNYSTGAISKNYTREYEEEKTLYVYDVYRMSYYEILEENKTPVVNRDVEILDFEFLDSSMVIESACYAGLVEALAENESYLKNKTTRMHYSKLYKHLKIVSQYIRNPYLDKVVRKLDNIVRQIIKEKQGRG